MNDPLIGSLDSQGHPTLKIRVYGISPEHGQEFEAMIDTGFTGFLTLPLVSAIPLGLTLVGTTQNVYADGSQGTSLTVLGTVVFGKGEEATGLILLNQGNQPLLGMAFLRITKKCILLTSVGYSLFDEGPILQAIKKAVETAQSDPEASGAAAPAEPTHP